MKLHTLSVLSLALISLNSAFAAEDIFSQTKFGLDSRLRYEMVNQANHLETADAFTLRIRPSIQTGSWHGLSGFVQGEGTIELNEHFNSTRNAETNYSSVPDPENLQLNQLYLKYASNPKFDVTLGRQLINLDNQRFIGSVAWRQNDQTFDAVTLNVKPLANVGLYYAYVNQVNTIFGRENPEPKYVQAQDGEQDGDIHLIQAKWNDNPALNMTAYGYLMDFNDLAAWSNQTYGLRLTGKMNKLRYVAEYAKQTDYADQPLAYDADYYTVELGYNLTAEKPLGEIAFGYEVLGSDHGRIGFQTPLATKHKFNGWTDIFLNTPANGLTDLYLSSNLNILDQGKLGTEYHHYRSDEHSLDYGQEYAVSFSHPLPLKGLAALAKFSSYQAEDYGVNTDKFWLQLDYKY
jgi:hypothetical protein